MDVQLNSPASDPVVGVTVYRTFKNGTSINRDTFFVWEEGTWKHRFGQEENDLYMPSASYQEFVDAQSGAQTTREGNLSEAEEQVEQAVRSHYEAIGRGDLEEAYSYFGPSMRATTDEQAWIEGEQSYDITSATIHTVKVDEVSGDTATATVDVSTTDNTGTPRFVITWKLVEEGGQWKLDKQLSAQRSG
jgi:Domain of unknown function (DUF4440)